MLGSHPPHSRAARHPAQAVAVDSGERRRLWSTIGQVSQRPKAPQTPGNKKSDCSSYQTG